MTAARRKQKCDRRRGAAALVGAALLAAVAVPARGGLSERIVADWHTGLAIGGYDPVAYFTDGRPMAGTAEVELRYQDVVWRFRNVGNRAAFAERPDVYVPQYGGYDAIDVARGVAVPGNPDIWAIVGERLFLFYNAAQRDSFVADSARLSAAANRKWPAVMERLSP
jgi:hypothetical protein